MAEYLIVPTGVSPCHATDIVVGDNPKQALQRYRDHLLKNAVVKFDGGVRVERSFRATAMNVVDVTDNLTASATVVYTAVIDIQIEEEKPTIIYLPEHEMPGWEPPEEE